MNDSDEKPLLGDLLNDAKLAALREDSLRHGLAEVRRVRRAKTGLRLAITAMVPACLVVTLIVAFIGDRRGARAAREVAASGAATAVSPATPVARDRGAVVTTLTDEELFALFPNRSLALIGKPGQQELVVLGAVRR